MKGRVVTVAMILLAAWWLNRANMLPFERYVVVTVFAVEMVVAFTAGWVARKGWEGKNGQHRDH